MVPVIENIKKKTRVSFLLFLFIVCFFNTFSYSQNSKNSDKVKTTNSVEKELEGVDYELIELIKLYKKHIVMGNVSEAEKLKQTIIRITDDMYPDKVEKIQKALGETIINDNKTVDINYKNEKNEELIANPTEEKSSLKSDFSSKSEKASKNKVYSDWETFKNPYEALQVRYRLDKKEGDVGYYQAQFRINYDEPTLCKDSRCLGYALCLGIPQLNDKDVSYIHLIFYYPNQEIFDAPELIPMKLSFSDGSKRMLKQDGFYYKANEYTEEVYLQYFFINSATSILQGSPIKINNFIESKAIILK